MIKYVLATCVFLSMCTLSQANETSVRVSSAPAAQAPKTEATQKPANTGKLYLCENTSLKLFPWGADLSIYIA
ncbi:MAG: hypothetical protein Q8K75_10605 [Chlamydiales bacterium]|nr:hypothetical protein [Chlamydiales bacterium]